MAHEEKLVAEWFKTASALLRQWIDLVPSEAIQRLNGIQALVDEWVGVFEGAAFEVVFEVLGERAAQVAGKCRVCGLGCEREKQAARVRTSRRTLSVDVWRYRCRTCRTNRSPVREWLGVLADQGVALTREQLGTFLAAARTLSPHGWYPLCVLGFGSDARFSDLAAVLVGDLDLEPEVGVWLCRRHLVQVRSSSESGIKWNTRGVVRLLDAETTRLLRPFLVGKKPDDLLFRSDQGGCQFRSNGGCNLFIKEVARAASLPEGLTSKVFRRTFITLSHLSTMADALTQAQAGHTDPKTTAAYIKPSLDHRREHARKMASVLYLVEEGDD